VTETSVAKIRYPQLSRPPIREALIDIRLTDVLPASFNERLAERQLSGFSRGVEIKMGGFSFEIGVGKPSLAKVTSDEAMGLRFDNADRSQAVQYRRNGMTFSILKNYATWDLFRNAGRELWQQYIGLSGPVKVMRLALRYVNVIEVPMGDDFDEYLTTSPRVPADAPQFLTSFLQRIVVPFNEIDSYAIITQAFEHPTETSLPTVLDIDVITGSTFDGDDPGVWDKFEKLRVVTNRIFFSSLTEKAMESYR
jgi:uncharacterized protein (TIGR04255 family)